MISFAIFFSCVKKWESKNIRSLNLSFIIYASVHILVLIQYQIIKKTVHMFLWGNPGHSQTSQGILNFQSRVATLLWWQTWSHKQNPATLQRKLTSAIHISQPKRSYNWNKWIKSFLFFPSTFSSTSKSRRIPSPSIRTSSYHHLRTTHQDA